MNEKKVKEKIEYNGIQLDSKEELHVAWWLDELKEKGYIERWTKADELELSAPLKGVIREHSYTADFLLSWVDGKPFRNINTRKALIDDNSSLTWLEVKPSFDQNNMTRAFKINQKWVYDKYRIYVNLVIPEKLFKQTFCPERYRLTDSGKGPRKLKESYLTLDEYIIKYNRERVQKNTKK